MGHKDAGDRPRSARADGEDVAAAERRADRDLYLELRRSGFRGRDWRQCAEVLVEYGSGVLNAWLWCGLLAGKVAADGHGVVLVPASVASCDDVRQEVVDDVLVEALVLFRRQLEQGEWDPDGGRSLRSYFVGTCLLVCPNVLRRWSSQESREVKAVAALAARRAEGSAAHERATDEVDARLSMEALVAGEDERVVEVVRLAYHGYRNVEIAELMQISPASVSGILRRWRSKAMGTWQAQERSS